MKAENLTISLELDLACEPDELNGTAILAPRGGEWVNIWPDRAGDLVAGEILLISVPSGTLQGEIESILPAPQSDGYEYTHLMLKDATWSGKAGGLAGGFCACGSWRIGNPGTAWVVETSAHSTPVRYDIYEAVRQFADLAWREDAPPKAERMADLLGVLVDWRVDIAAREAAEGSDK